MVEYLIEQLSDKYEIAILSRGYKRRSSGFLIADLIGDKTADKTADKADKKADKTANEKVDAASIGDEPFQIFQKYPQVTVSVGEDRVLAIPELLFAKPETQVILLDDAFQHRYLNVGYQILLTSYSRLFTDDWYLPTGDLRDLKSSYKRADLIIVTKCPSDLDKISMNKISQKISPISSQKLLFACIKTKGLCDVSKPEDAQLLGLDFLENKQVVLLSGIAHSDQLSEFLKGKRMGLLKMKFSDHHYFTEKDIRDIKKKLMAFSKPDAVVVTTEKDWARLQLHKALLVELDIPIFVLKIEMKFLDGGNPIPMVEEYILAEEV